MVITCVGGIKGVVFVKEDDTLADVQALIYNEFDEDLILPDLEFHIDDVRFLERKRKKDVLGNTLLGKRLEDWVEEPVKRYRE